MDTYTFIEHPIENLHQIIPGILPGIEKMITVHWDEMKHQYIGILSEKQNHDYTRQGLNIEKSLPALQHFMEEKNSADWHNRQGLPFEIEMEQSNPELNLFSELQNIVLLIRVPVPQREINHLVFLYLNESPSNFGVTNTNNPLTTENKSMIACVLNNAVRTFINMQLNDKNILKSYNQRTRQIIDQAETLKYELQRTKENYGISLVKLCQQIINSHTFGSGRSFRLSPGAFDKIKNYKGEIKDLEAIIKDTIAYVESLYVDYSNDIEILEWHIAFDTFVKKESTRTAEPIKHEDKFFKTISLLDRLENAAISTKSKQLKMTGTNVGSAFQEPISAPAISDALYNHKSKINNLMKKFPERWETIRADFKPLKNILEEEKG